MTKEQLNQALTEVESIRTELIQKLNQINKDESNIKLKSAKDLIGKCYKFVGSYSIHCYKIISLKSISGNYFICTAIVCIKDRIEYDQNYYHWIGDYDAIEEINLTEFESKFDEVCYNLKNN